ncbi:MAG: type II secretion system protein GspK [Phycisphaerae bacterium]|nr:type II secretion system protein GspK [Phycisphaerae bacterium]
MIRQGECRKAMVLIVVVYIVAAYSMLAFALAFRSRIAIKETQLLTERLQQDQIALAACAQARSILEADDHDLDCLDEPWFGWHELVPAETADQSISPDEGPWQVSWRLIDESAKINVNTAPADLLLELECLDEAAVASILDWIDQDDVPNPDGAENDYYSGLENAYSCKNGPIDNIEELLLVKGISLEIFYGYNLDEGDSHLSETGPETSEFIDEVPQNGAPGLCDLLTVYGDGRININTASKQVLDTIPMLSDAAVSEIISMQKGAPRKFSSMDDIQNNDNFNAVDILLLAQIAKFNSNHFQLHIKVRKKERPFWCEYMATIERQEENTRILSWQRKSRTIVKDITRFIVDDDESSYLQGLK